MHEKYTPYLIQKVNEDIIVVWYIVAYARVEQIILVKQSESQK